MSIGILGKSGESPEKSRFFRLWDGGIGDIQCKPLAYIDDLGAVVLVVAGDVLTIAHVHMAMEQVLGMVAVDQLQKGGKSLMSGILGVPHSHGGCVGHHHIHTAGLPDLALQPQDPAAHLGLGVLEVPGAVFAAAPQT